MSSIRLIKTEEPTMRNGFLFPPPPPPARDVPKDKLSRFAMVITCLFVTIPMALAIIAILLFFLAVLFIAFPWFIGIIVGIILVIMLLAWRAV